jgi:hypothetical protein
MSKKGTLIALCALCALTAGASAVPSAFALGTASFTCKAGGTGFADAHCTTAGTPGSFGHESIPEKTETEFEANNEKTNAETNGAVPVTFRSTISGVNVEIQFLNWVFHGRAEQHRISGYWTFFGNFALTLTFPEFKAPAGKGCTIKGEMVASKELTATTNEQGMALKIEPKEGTTLASFVVEGCSIAALNGTYELKGSLKGTPNGAVLEFSHASVTEQGTLTLHGQKAGIEGKVTLKARANSSQSYTPIGLTTTE